MKKLYFTIFLSTIGIPILRQTQLSAQDVGVIQIQSPKPIAYCFVDSVDFIFVIRNFDSIPANLIPYSVLAAPLGSGIPYSNSGVIASLTPGQADTIIFSGIPLNYNDAYVFTAYTLLPGDINVNNDLAVVQMHASKLQDSVSLTNLNCNNDFSGAASMQLSNGIMPYTYNWSNGSSAPAVGGLSAGWHSYSMRDSVGCTVEDSIFLTEPAALLASIADSGSTLVATASGGTGTYKYYWNTGDSTDIINISSSGTYTVTVTDENDCVDTATLNIVLSAHESLLQVTDFHIYPNPVKDYLCVKSMRLANRNLKMDLMDVYGRYVWQGIQVNHQQCIELKSLNLSGGLYFLKIYDKNQRVTFKLRH